MTPRSGGEPAVVERGPDEILIFARTLERAIDQARSYWRVEEKHLRVETIREPMAGWLGFGRREGLFRAVRTPSQ